MVNVGGCSVAFMEATQQQVAFRRDNETGLVNYYGCQVNIQ